jgi:hypothetical protein
MRKRPTFWTKRRTKHSSRHRSTPGTSISIKVFFMTTDKLVRNPISRSARVAVNADRVADPATALAADMRQVTARATHLALHRAQVRVTDRALRRDTVSRARDQAAQVVRVAQANRVLVRVVRTSQVNRALARVVRIAQRLATQVVRVVLENQVVRHLRRTDRAQVPAITGALDITAVTAADGIRATGLTIITRAGVRVGAGTALITHAGGTRAFVSRSSSGISALRLVTINVSRSTKAAMTPNLTLDSRPTSTKPRSTLSKRAAERMSATSRRATVSFGRLDT